MKFKRKHRQKRSRKDRKDDVLRDNYDDDLVDGATQSDEDEEPSKLVKIFKMFSFDSHRKMERLMRQFFMAAGVMLLGLGITIYHNYKVAQEQNQSLTSTSSNISFSQSGATMLLANLISTKSGKTVYLPIKFQDMTSLPGSADHFSLFVSATDGSLSYKPYGQILVYGTTGYGMLIFHSDTGFKNQPITMYLKNNVNFTGNQLGATQSDSDVQAIQRKYDVAIFNLNLGASSVQKNNNLPDGDAKPDLVYNDIFGASQRRTVVNNISNDLAGVKNDYQISASVYQQLQERGYKMPTPPTFVTSNKWRPSVQVNPVSGQIGNSKNYVDNNGHSSKLTKQSMPFPKVVYKKNGDSYSKLNIANATQDSPDLESWQKLQTLWQDIYNRKYDAYVTQYAKLYAITQQVFQNGSSYSVSSPQNFTILGNISIK